jgi:hypothetical protein
MAAQGNEGHEQRDKAASHEPAAKQTRKRVEGASETGKDISRKRKFLI